MKPNVRAADHPLGNHKVRKATEKDLFAARVALGMGAPGQS